MTDIYKDEHECSIYKCARRARYWYASATIERLNENWRACGNHRDNVRKFLVERDMAWGRGDVSVREHKL